MAGAVAALGTAGGRPAAAQDGGADAATVPPVVVAEVNGFLDPVVVDFIERTIDRAEADGAQAVILQTTTTRSVVSEERFVALAERIAGADIPVGIWVGPSGGDLQGAPAQLLGVVPFSGVAPGVTIGRAGTTVEGLPTTLSVDLQRRLAEERFTAEQARDAGLVRLPADAPEQGTPTVGDLVVAIDGFEWNGRTLDTARVVQTDDGPRREALRGPLFTQPGLTAQLMHTVASPPVAYLLLVIGLMLLLFEFFTAGVGVAGVVGAVCLVLGCYGAAVLPTRWWAFGLLVLAVLAFAVDVQTGVPRFWTGVGVVAFVLASFLLFDDVMLSWITLLAGIAGMLLAVLKGMPLMVRTRFATSVIDRDWLVGAEGRLVTAVDPHGVVEVDGARWGAVAADGPVPAGHPVEVVGVDGPVLLVAATAVPGDASTDDDDGQQGGR